MESIPEQNALEQGRETVGGCLAATSNALERGGIIRPRRHAELILEIALGVDRLSLYLGARNIMPSQSWTQIEYLLARRLRGEPIQYLTGRAPFWGREFEVHEGVFIPRFDTELLIELFQRRFADDISEGRPIEVLDLCCGCGTIGLTIAAEYPSTIVTLVDNSQEAVRITLLNAAKLGLSERVSVLLADALDLPSELNGEFNAALANPPYIPAEGIPRLNPDVLREPLTALTDGGDGLSFYRRWVDSMPPLFKAGGWLALEIDDHAADSVYDIFKEHRINLQVHQDLNGLPRAVTGEIP